MPIIHQLVKWVIVMAKLRIKDNSENDELQFKPISTLTRKVENKTLQQLEKEGIFVFPKTVNDTDDLSQDQFVLQQVNHAYRTGNVMGFLGAGEDRLAIQSRFSTGQHDYLLQYMLEKVLDFPNILNLDTDANRNHQFLNLLVFLFPYYLRTAMRKGPFKTYVRTQYNNQNILGVVDIARHIRCNVPFTGKIAYNQREFSYDNNLMELIRHTIEFIQTKSFGTQLLRTVNDEVMSVVSCTNQYNYQNRRKIMLQNQKNPVRHAYYQEYRNLQRLCLMILKHEKQQIGTGMQPIHGILFDGAWLWEEYIHILIGSQFYHPRNKAGEGAQRLFEKNNGLIYPDFISRNDDRRVIADTKYKPINNIGNRDYLQVLAYMFRFDARKGFYLYPESKKNAVKMLRLNQGSTYEGNVKPREDIQVTKCGLKIPTNVSNYEQFIEEIKRNETEFLQQLQADQN